MFHSKIIAYKNLLCSLFYLAKKKPQLAKNYYILSLINGYCRNRSLEKKLDHFNDEKKRELKVAVSGWELSHNAAGRTVTLAELYYYTGFRNVEMIGCVINSENKPVKKIWEPLVSHWIPVKFSSIYREDIDTIVPKLAAFVVKNPYDVVHLSKPRITNIILGLMYKLIWNATVIVDIDDEELAFGNEDNNSIKNRKIEKPPKNIRDPFWTEKSIKSSGYFDLLSVSNPALQKKYGGFIIPHVRDENKFIPSESQREATRRKFNIPSNKIVVIFFGTPKRHKGIIETAKILAELNDNRILYTIVGDFQDKSLKSELQSISNINVSFFSNQKFKEAACIVGMGDICILLQDEKSDISKYQLPAKLIDALGMGLKIFLQRTEATANLIEGSQIQFVEKSNLLYYLKDYIDNEYGKNNKIRNQREYFLENFSMNATVDKINYIIDMHQSKKDILKDNYDKLSCYSKLDLLSLLESM